MAYLRCLAGGLIGGLIGMGIWAAVAYATGFEVGYIAWGVGFLAGFGVRLMAKDREGPAFGVLAVLIAATSIAAAKYLVICLHFSAFGEFDVQADSQETMISEVANEVATEFEKAGRKVDWPPEDELEDESQIESARAKSAVWQEAAQRWNALPPEKQQARIEENKRQTDKVLGELTSALRSAAFRESFSAYDLLWFGLAALTAFKLGSGAVEGS